MGLQANTALADFPATGWRAAIIEFFGIGFNPQNPLANFMHGLLYFLPIYITTLVVGGIWEVLFATVRRHEVNEGFLVSSMGGFVFSPPALITPSCLPPYVFVFSCFLKMSIRLR